MRHLGTALLLLALFASGCSSGPAPDPAGDSGPATPSETAASDAPSEAATADNGEQSSDDADPLRYSSTKSHMVIQCFPQGDRRMIVFDEVRARRDVSLTGATVAPEADALQVTGGWLAPLSPRGISESGVLDLDAGGTSMADIDTWADRMRLPGAQLEPGTTYMFFVRVDVRPDRSLGDISLGWEDGETTGSSPYDFEGRTRSGGC